MSILVTGPDRTSWLLETAVVDRGSSTILSPPAHRERVGDRVLTSFRFKNPGCGGRDLCIRVAGADGAPCGSTRIPFPPCGDASRVLVPEWAPAPGEAPAWIPLGLRLDAAAVVSLSVVNPEGAVLRTWKPMLLPDGTAVVLWDGRTDDGTPSAVAACRLQAALVEPDPGRGALVETPPAGAGRAPGP